MEKWEMILRKIPLNLQKLFKDNWDNEIVECAICKVKYPNHGLFINKYNNKYRCRECKGVSIIPKELGKIFKEEMPEHKKYCPICKKILNKDVEFFHINNNSKDGFRHTCKECRKLYYKENKEVILEKRKQHYIENREKVIKQTKEWKINNKAQYREARKQYYKKNKEYIKSKSKTNMYKRMEKDIGFKILHRCRTRLYWAIKGYVKSARTLELIGCSVEYLLKHLEKQFQEGMTWENYGEWHIDHIMPCASFDFSIEDEQRECFNYKNLQPLWAQDNLRKSDKIIASE